MISIQLQLLRSGLPHPRSPEDHSSSYEAEQMPVALPHENVTCNETQTENDVKAVYSCYYQRPNAVK